MAREVISGVGKNARRTDKNLSAQTTQPIRNMRSTNYGEGVELQSLQSGAPMEGKIKTPRIASNPQVSRSARVVPLTAETQYPDQVPETGMNFGEGPGPEILGNLTAEPERVLDILQRMAGSDPSGEIAKILEDALLQGQ
jgi:hypothetical protein